MSNEQNINQIEQTRLFTGEYVNETDKIKQVNNELKKPRLHSYFGIFFSIVSSLLDAISSVMIKKAQFFTGTEQAAIRYAIQMLVMFSIAFYNRVNLIGPEKDRKLLLLRGCLGVIGLTTIYVSIKFIDPSDAVSLFHAKMILVTILARFVLNEKLSFIHIFSLKMALTGKSEFLGFIIN